jgi:hypothetical protein
MDSRTTGGMTRLDCPASQPVGPTVFSTLSDKSAPHDGTGRVLQTTSQCIRADGREVISSLSSAEGIAPSHVLVSVSQKPTLAIVSRGILLLVALAVCTAAWADHGKPADPMQTTFDRVKKMSAAEQQAWLVQLEERAARAARLALSPDEAATQQARTQSLLHRKIVTWKVLREVIVDAEAREKAAAAQAAKERPVEQAIAEPRPAKKQAAKPQVAEPPAAVKVEEPATKPHAIQTIDEAAKSKPVERKVAKPVVDDVATVPRDELPPGSVKVNVEELDARIAGSNLAFREMETQLNEKGTVWSAEKLKPLLERLEVLVLRYNDLGLFRNAVPKAERSGVTDLESPKVAISQFIDCVVQARNRANDPKVISDEAERKAELASLDAISRGLGKLGGK